MMRNAISSFDSNHNERMTFEPSVETLRLVEAMSKAKVGDRFSYKQLNDIAECDVRETGRLFTARNILQRDMKIVFGCIRGVGLERLADGAIVDTAESRRDRIRRCAHRGIKTLGCADGKKLTDKEAVKKSAYLMLMDSIRSQARKTTVSRITDVFKPGADAIRQMGEVK